MNTSGMPVAEDLVEVLGARGASGDVRLGSVDLPDRGRDELVADLVQGGDRCVVGPVAFARETDLRDRPVLAVGDLRGADERVRPAGLVDQLVDRRGDLAAADVVGLDDDLVDVAPRRGTRPCSGRRSG